MTNGLPSKPIPPSWPASRPFVLCGQPPAASLAQAAPSRSTASRAARETSGACPPTRDARHGKQTNNHPKTAPHKPGHHGHRPTTTTQESTTSPPAPRPTRPHRVTLLPTSTPEKKGGQSTARRVEPCGQSTRERGAWYSPPFFAAQTDATSTRSAVPGFGVRGFSFDHATTSKAHPPSPDRQGVGWAGKKSGLYQASFSEVSSGPHRAPIANLSQTANAKCKTVPFFQGRIRSPQSAHAAARTESIGSMSLQNRVFLGKKICSPARARLRFAGGDHP